MRTSRIPLFRTRKLRFKFACIIAMQAFVVCNFANNIALAETAHNLNTPQKIVNRNNNKINNNNHQNQIQNTKIDSQKPSKTTAIPTEFEAPLSNWPLPIEHKTGWMKPDIKTIHARIEATNRQPKFADPISLKILRNNPMALLRQLGGESLLQSMNGTNEEKDPIQKISEQIAKRLGEDKFIVTPQDLDWMDLEKLANVLQSKTALPELALGDWTKAINDPEKAKTFENYFQGDFQRVRSAINAFTQQHHDAETIPFQELLPNNVKALYGKYSHLRGRNCFGTALEFATPRNTLDKLINIETEEGHYRTMINSDEFARALWLGYNELTTEEILMGLNWGDVVVFYDASGPYSWQSLRHAVVHLGGDIYFHKQSKSAASPIELVQWDSLVSLWSRITPALDYKVYRRLPLGTGSGSFQKPTRAVEKLTWTR